MPRKPTKVTSQFDAARIEVPNDLITDHEIQAGKWRKILNEGDKFFRRAALAIALDKACELWGQYTAGKLKEAGKQKELYSYVQAAAIAAESTLQDLHERKKLAPDDREGLYHVGAMIKTVDRIIDRLGGEEKKAWESRRTNLRNMADEEASDIYNLRTFIESIRGPLVYGSDKPQERKLPIGADSFEYEELKPVKGREDIGEEDQTRGVVYEDKVDQTGQTNQKSRLDPNTLPSTKDLPIADWSKLPEPQN